MPLAFEQVDLQLESISWLPCYEGMGSGARRRTWPVRSRLDSWLSLGRLPLEVDFVVRSAGKRGVWAMLIVPIDEGKNLVAELVKS